MTATKGDGLTAANDQPAETKHTANFIARRYSFASKFIIDRGVALGDVAIILMALATVAIVLGGAL